MTSVHSRLKIDPATAHQLAGAPSAVTDLVRSQFEAAFPAADAEASWSRTPEGVFIRIEVGELQTEHNLWAIDAAQSLAAANVDVHIYATARDRAVTRFRERRARVESSIRRSKAGA